TEQNFWTEYIKFEVADFESSYHAILGRPALAKFMVVPHYVYLLLKMPGNTGVLSLRGDLLKSFECDKEAIDHASTIRVPRSVSEILAAAKELSLKESMPSKKPSQSSVKLTNDVAPRLSSYKRETTPKQPSSEQDWVTNRNSSSSTSLGPIETYSRGNQQICQGCPKS